MRGASCALGHAAVQLAKALGCKVIATARRAEKLPALRGKARADKALELVGPKTLGDTLLCMNRGGVVCNTGNLGGVYRLDRFDPIKDIPNGVYLTGFFSNYPTQAAVDAMFAFLNGHRIAPMVGAVFPFSKIAEACAALDEGTADGKIVVTL